MSEELQTEERASGLKKALKPILLVTAIVVLMILARVFGLGEKLELLKDWITGLGQWGPIVFVLIYIIATIAMVPGTALTVGAGALFGSVTGVILVSIGSTVGATICFLIARYFARDSISKWLEGNEKFQKLDDMSEKHGAMVVAITRLVPLFPFNLLNYGLGLTGARFGTYVLWSWVCMLPATILFVVGADALSSALSSGEVPWPLLGVLAAVIAFLAVVVRFAKKKIDNDSEDRPSPEKESK
jgi:uncharacterized membrane protein YdjX (TVP38/TMEM64 family)